MTRNPNNLSRPAGALYLAIIPLGLSAEIFVRSAMVVPGDPAATADNIRTGATAFRLSLIGDAVMVAADIALALLLYALLRPVGPLLAALAAAFRLMQAAVIAGNLIQQQIALLWLTSPLPGVEPQTAAALAYQALTAHAHGYDLGLIFFGINSVLTGLLLLRAPGFANAFGYLLMAAGAVYLTGSGLRFLVPAAFAAFAPAYLIAVIAETALALRLLTMGQWHRRAHREPASA